MSDLLGLDQQKADQSLGELRFITVTGQCMHYEVSVCCTCKLVARTDLVTADSKEAQEPDTEPVGIKV